VLTCLVFAQGYTCYVRTTANYILLCSKVSTLFTLVRRGIGEREAWPIQRADSSENSRKLINYERSNKINKTNKMHKFMPKHSAAVTQRRGHTSVTLRNNILTDRQGWPLPMGQPGQSEQLAAPPPPHT
jgi:hypothetical protein